MKTYKSDKHTTGSHIEAAGRVTGNLRGVLVMADGIGPFRMLIPEQYRSITNISTCKPRKKRDRTPRSRMMTWLPEQYTK